MGRHHADEAGHVGQEDVAVDVGQNEVELSGKSGEKGAVAAERLQAVVHVVDDGIVARIVGTPLVDVVAYARVCAQLQGADAQNACSASAVQYATALQIHAKQRSTNHACRLVRACAEGQMRIDFDTDG